VAPAQRLGDLELRPFRACRLSLGRARNQAQGAGRPGKGDVAPPRVRESALVPSGRRSRARPARAPRERLVNRVDEDPLT
jgi:hypothetical protein